jgi:hypothetical protein
MKVEKRGRPSISSTDLSLKPTKFTREFKDHTGHRSVWTYNLDKNPYGPVCVEEFYPEGWTSDVQVEVKLPKTKRKYLNPKTGKMVGFGRAKELGLVK